MLGGVAIGLSVRSRHGAFRSMLVTGRPGWKKDNRRHGANRQGHRRFWRAHFPGLHQRPWTVGRAATLATAGFGVPAGFFISARSSACSTEALAMSFPRIHRRHLRPGLVAWSLICPGAGPALPVPANLRTADFATGAVFNVMLQRRPRCARSALPALGRWRVGRPVTATRPCRPLHLWGHGAKGVGVSVGMHRPRLLPWEPRS